MSDVRRFEGGDAWVEIDLDLCTAAGECVSACPGEVYEIIDGKVRAEAIGDCLECGACEGACPADAILSHWVW